MRDTYLRVVCLPQRRIHPTVHWSVCLASPVCSTCTYSSSHMAEVGGAPSLTQSIIPPPPSTPPGRGHQLPGLQEAPADGDTHNQFARCAVEHWRGYTPRGRLVGHCAESTGRLVESDSLCALRVPPRPSLLSLHIFSGVPLPCLRTCPLSPPPSELHGGVPHSHCQLIIMPCFHAGLR